jgi:glycosyltransferase involved in cell wall biosynthesis
MTAASNPNVNESLSGKKIAVLLPCYNEEAKIDKVTRDYRKALPTADVLVFDNNSSDNTAAIVAEAGAVVYR